MHLDYERYLDQVLGGWIGKSMGGAVGARYEGNKGWIEISPDEMFPERMPPNDDLDLQIVWLKVLEEKGAALDSDDLAAAWLEGCWYPFNEYGIFRRNWRLGIRPPMSGRYTNQFWETGMGCPIRSEIWGYVFPGAPDLAARYAWVDGTLDHTEQSVGGEMMLAAMASMAFFVPDVRRLADMFIHYLPEGTPIERLTRAAFAAYDEGLSMRDARDRLMALAGHPEACDSQNNVPFTFLGLLYGGNDLQQTMLSTLRCGYDTDCTLATAAALVGQILGASRIPESLKRPVGDELVMGIQYRRPEMTLSALARDTARTGVRLAAECDTGIEFVGAPAVSGHLAPTGLPGVRIAVDYLDLPCAAPGDTVRVTVRVVGQLGTAARLRLAGPDGWSVTPSEATLRPDVAAVEVALHAPLCPTEWPMKNVFTARLETTDPVEYSFGIAGAGLYRFLGVYYDALPDESDPVQVHRRFNQHFVSLDRPYLPEPDPDSERLYGEWSRKLGRPAIVTSYEHEVDLTQLIGLRGPCCAYVDRTVISPVARPVFLVVGNTDSYRLYLNGELIGEADEAVWWSPFNAVYKADLKEGENRILIKLLRRGDRMRFTLGFRVRASSGEEVLAMRGMDVGERDDHWESVLGKLLDAHNAMDWVVDVSDRLPDS
jgi:ADP-ribosylglycohydrolase